MALLYDARFRAIDASGNPLSGATLTIYTANTTSPAAVFTDTGLSVPLSNPTTGADKSDAGGWFPQIFAAEGTTTDITLKNAAGVTVQTYVDVVFIGSDTGTFSRTLAGNTRLKFSDAAGIVKFEVGDASPDDVGGQLTIQGWAGTQGDTLTLNFATTAIGGALTIGQLLSLTGSASSPALSLLNAKEPVTVSATAATGTISLYWASQSILYYTTASSANWTVDLAFSASVSLNTALSTGQSMTFVFMVTNTGTPHYNTTVKVDGATAGVTTKWLTGAPSAGTANAVDAYTFTVLKTGNAAFTVFASLAPFV